MIKNISNLGDAALYCDFGKEVNKEINSKVIRYFKSIQKENIDGINNLTPSYNKLIVSFNLRKINFQIVRKLKFFRQNKCALTSKKLFHSLSLTFAVSNTTHFFRAMAFLN